MEERGWALGCWASLDLSRRAKLIEALGRFREASSFLELGCHVGSNLRLLAIALGPERLTGLDINQDAIALGQALFTEERVDNVTLESGESFPLCRVFPTTARTSCFLLRTGLRSPWRPGAGHRPYAPDRATGPRRRRAPGALCPRPASCASPEP